MTSQPLVSQSDGRRLCEEVAAFDWNADFERLDQEQIADVVLFMSTFGHRLGGKADPSTLVAEIVPLLNRLLHAPETPSPDLDRAEAALRQKLGIAADDPLDSPREVLEIAKASLP